MDKDDILVRFLCAMSTAIVFQIVIVVLLMCCGCASHRDVRTNALESSTMHVETRTDVARVVDSVFVFWRDTVLLRGDTTEVTRWRTQYVARMQTAARVDTLVRIDTLRVTERVETAAALTWWQRLRQSLFYPLVALLIACFTIIFVQRHGS